MNVVIFHNPECGTSRNTLGFLRAAGIEPRVVEYLETPPSRDELRAMISQAGMKVRDAIREKGTPYAELGLGDPALTDDHLLDAMMKEPILINRPFVVTDLGVGLCRPSDMVLDLLPPETSADFRKEDGSPMLRSHRVGLEDIAARLETAGLPVGSMDSAQTHFFHFLGLDGARIGVGGFELYGTDALLRSVLVEPSRRREGVGSSLIQILMRRAYDAGARSAYVLTTDLVRFFEGEGFKPIDRTGLPADIADTEQVTALCPSSAHVMTRRISL
jgi:arsenate reductase